MIISDRGALLCYHEQQRYFARMDHISVFTRRRSRRKIKRACFLRPRVMRETCNVGNIALVGYYQNLTDPYRFSLPSRSLTSLLVQSDHQGDILHDLRYSNFWNIGYAIRARPFVVLCNRHLPSQPKLPPIHNFPAPTANARIRKATSGIYTKQEFSDDEETRPKKISHVILNHESDKYGSLCPPTKLRVVRSL